MISLLSASTRIQLKQMDAESYFRKGIQYYDKGYSLKSKEEIQSIIRALELFVECNKMLERSSALKPKALCYIASCNYKIGNISTAYQIARMAKEHISYAINEGEIMGIAGQMIGEDRIDFLIETITEQFPNEIYEAEVVVDENELNHYGLEVHRFN